MVIAEIKPTLNQIVRHDGSFYTFEAAIFRRHKKTGEFYYQAELKDQSAERSILVCDLKDVETT